MIIPLRDVNTVEKVDSPVGGTLYMNAMVVTTKGKVIPFIFYFLTELLLKIKPSQ
jgi:flavoprotein